MPEEADDRAMLASRVAAARTFSRRTAKPLLSPLTLFAYRLAALCALLTLLDMCLLYPVRLAPATLDRTALL